MNSLRKPTTGFWITVALVAVLVVYPLSFGPACWLHEWNGIGESAIPMLYYPMIWLAKHSEFGDLINSYATAGRPRGRYPSIIFDGTVAWCWDDNP